LEAVSESVMGVRTHSAGEGGGDSGYGSTEEGAGSKTREKKKIRDQIWSALSKTVSRWITLMRISSGRGISTTKETDIKKKKKWWFLVIPFFVMDGREGGESRGATSRNWALQLKRRKT